MNGSICFSSKTTASSNMIKTVRQLKDLLRNLSKDKSADAQILMRNYMMERISEIMDEAKYPGIRVGTSSGQAFITLLLFCHPNKIQLLCHFLKVVFFVSCSRLQSDLRHLGYSLGYEKLTIHFIKCDQCDLAARLCIQ